MAEIPTADRDLNSEPEQIEQAPQILFSCDTLDVHPATHFPTGRFQNERLVGMPTYTVTLKQELSPGSLFGAGETLFVEPMPPSKPGAEMCYFITGNGTMSSGGGMRNASDMPPAVNEFFLSEAQRLQEEHDARHAVRHAVGQDMGR